MKKLGELNIGDTFYVVNRDPQGVLITSVDKHIISDILTIKIGKSLNGRRMNMEIFQE